MQYDLQCILYLENISGLIALRWQMGFTENENIEAK